MVELSMIQMSNNNNIGNIDNNRNIDNGSSGITVLKSEFESECSPRPLVSSSQIKTQAKFYSFTDFEMAFEKWKQDLHHPFRVASSETLRMPDGSTNSLFKYRYIVYHCAHYGNPRMRGVGKRPNQNYLPCGCKAMLRLNYSWSENCLRITTLNDVHIGHEVSPDAFYKFCTKPRRSFNVNPTQISTSAAASPASSNAASHNGSTIGSPSPANTEGSGRDHSLSPGTDHCPSSTSGSASGLAGHQNPSTSFPAGSAGQRQQSSSAFRPLSGAAASAGILNSMALNSLFLRQQQQALQQAPDPWQQLAAIMQQRPTAPTLPPMNVFQNSSNNSHNHTLLSLLQSSTTNPQALGSKPLLAGPVLPTSISAPVRNLQPLKSEEQAAPIDLSLGQKDKRSEEDRFQVVHPILQTLTDHLIGCQGGDFDHKMHQLQGIINDWKSCKLEPESQ